MNIIRSLTGIKEAFRTCWKLSGPEVRKLVLGTLFVGIFAATVEYVFALVLQSFLVHMKLFSPQNAPDFLSAPTLEIAIFALLLAGALRSLLEGLKIFVSRLAQQKFAQSNRLKLVQIALNNAGNLSSAKILSLFSDETNRSSNAILNMATFLIQSSLSAFLLLFSVINFFPATALGISLLFIFYVPIKLFERKVSKTGVHLSEEWEKTNYILTEGIRNNFYLRVIGKIESEIKKAVVSLQSYSDHFHKAFFLISLRSSVPSFFGILILVIIGYLQTQKNLFGNDFKFLEFFYLFLRFTQSVSQAVSSLGDFTINKESCNRLSYWYDKHHELVPEKNKSTAELKGPLSLEIKNLTFGYDEKTLFDNLNFKLTEGEALVITGESGVGKSSLIYLLLGVIDSKKGDILYSGHSIQDIREQLFSHLSYVGPHPFLIEGTIKENLLYGNEHTVSDEEIQTALYVGCLGEFVRNLKGGINTSLNEVASTISTGQKQRLMLVRALLRKPKILILDEATSNLDINTEMELIQNLKATLTDKICVIVSHKPTFNDLATKHLHLTPQ